MRKEIEALNLQDFIYYNVVQLRAPAHQVGTSLPIPPPADDYADGSWTDWSDTPALRRSAYLRSIVNAFAEHTRVTLVRLLRLEPGAIVKEHTDPTLGLEVPRSVIRLTIPIVTNDSVQFFLNGVEVPMNPGECWYLRLTDPHRVVNTGLTEGISMTIDMVPNDWLRTQIMKS